MTILAQDDLVVKTDSSVIRTSYFKYLNSIREFNELKNQTRTYYTDYFYDTKQIREQGVFDADGDYIGISRIYSEDGKLLVVTNHDLGLWNVIYKNNYPFYDLLCKMKLKGDSLIKSIYGNDFFDKNVIWNMNRCAIYNKNESGNWDDKFNSPPNKFLLRYNVRLNSEHIYKGMIRFELDSIGNYISNPYAEIYGFEKLGDSIKKEFQLKYDIVFKTAKEKGLIETENTKAIAFLKWECFKKSELYNGQFRFYIIIKTGSIKNSKKNGRSSITDKFDVYSFSPWTGAFIEKKKMKTISSWEKNSGSTTGLRPDE